MSVLLSASLLGQEEIVKFLLNRGADPNHRCRDGFTPLCAAAFRDFTPIFTELIKHDADWKLDGAVLLKLASGRNSAIAQKLMSYGAKSGGRRARTVDIAELTNNLGRMPNVKRMPPDQYKSQGVRARFVRGGRAESRRRKF